MVGLSGRLSHAILSVGMCQNMTRLLAKAATSVVLSGDQLMLAILFGKGCFSRRVESCGGRQQVTFPLFAPTANHVPSGDQRSVERRSQRMLLLRERENSGGGSCVWGESVEQSQTNSSLSNQIAKRLLLDQSSP